MDSCLLGWRAASLSLAWRVTLARLVLNVVPAYAMQTAVLPNELCQEIDKHIHNFILGSSQGAKKVHLVNWDMVCQPKELGGFGT
ncbi:Putative ribonuclease H protein At1g65750 [Linum grandiflorum]